MLRKLMSGTLLLIYWFAAVAVILYFLFWTGYQGKQQDRESLEILNQRMEPPRHVDAETMHLLGRLILRRPSHFIQFEQEKPSGVIRVCALGDSNTNGDEVGEHHDYPSYLQRQFKQQGYNHVQVLNFGNGWHGFAQLYVMWKRVARRFSCDFVLLLPMKFWAQRDTTFNHTNGRSPGYLHARLILDQNELRLLEPIGKTAVERRDAYLRPIPHWQYLRYDRSPTSIVNALVPAGRSLKNPFYYDPRPRAKEARDIYRKIVQSIASDGPQVIVLFRNQHQELYPELIPDQPPGIGAAFLNMPTHFPYLAPAGHPSSWGQELTANAFFRLLTADSSELFTQVGARDLSTHQNQETRALYSFEKIWLDYQGERLGYFVPVGSRKQNQPDLYIGALHNQNSAGLLALGPEQQSVSAACLLPLPEIPAIGSTLLFTPDKSDSEKVVLGKLFQPQPGIAIFKVALPQFIHALCRDQIWENKFIQGDGRLHLDDLMIAEIKDGKILPTAGKLLMLRDSGEYLAQVGRLPNSAKVQLVLQSVDGSSLRIPWLTFTTNQDKIFMSKQAPARHIRRAMNETALTRIPEINY